MATVTLDALYVHDYTDQTDYDTFDYHALAERWTVVGRVRRLAAGRLRLTTSPGPESVYEIDLRNQTAASVQALRDRTGTHVMVRDLRGRVIYGTFLSVEVVDRPENALADAMVTLETVTGSVAV